MSKINNLHDNMGRQITRITELIAAGLEVIVIGAASREEGLSIMLKQRLTLVHSRPHQLTFATKSKTATCWLSMLRVQCRSRASASYIFIRDGDIYFLPSALS